MNTKLNTVSGVCCLSLLRAYTCMFCSISILFLYVYVRMPSSPGSIAGVSSSPALPGYLVTHLHLCACVYIYIYTYRHIHIHIYMYMYIYIHIQVYINI